MERVPANEDNKIKGRVTPEKHYREKNEKSPTDDGESDDIRHEETWGQKDHDENIGRKKDANPRPR
jgi:hypothetical protein